MPIVSVSDNMQEMANPVFRENYFKTSAAENFSQIAKRWTIRTRGQSGYLIVDQQCDRLQYHVVSDQIESQAVLGPSAARREWYHTHARTLDPLSLSLARSLSLSLSHTHTHILSEAFFTKSGLH